MTELPDELKQLQESKERVYGPWRINMAGTSLQMNGLLLQFAANMQTQYEKVELPLWWSPLMMCTVKLNRIASGHYHADNFRDLHVYLSFVEEMQKEEQDGKR